MQGSLGAQQTTQERNSFVYGNGKYQALQVMYVYNWKYIHIPVYFNHSPSHMASKYLRNH